MSDVAQRSILGDRPSEKVMALAHLSDIMLAHHLSEIASDPRYVNADDRRLFLGEAANRLRKFATER